ncbi:MAG: N-methyl-L-tryptophan oxidase [Actinomycetota bacterium]
MPRPDRIHDLAVIGLGAFGAAVAHYAAALGLDVIAFDRHEPPHEFGSSHAETRITRLAVGEGDHYVPFAKRSHALWRELEPEGDPLLHQPGGLIIAPAAGSDDERWGDFVTSSEAVARRGELPFERLDPPAARALHPGLRIRDTDAVGLEPSGGLVMAEAAVRAHLHHSRQHGADIRTHCRVTGVDRGDDGVIVRTVDGDHRAAHAVVCAGPWTAELSDATRLRVTRQEVYWFEADLDLWSTDRTAFAIWCGTDISEYLGVFAVAPNAPRQAVKVVPEQFTTATSAGAVDRTITEADVSRFYEQMVEPRLAGVSARCVDRSVCLYTNTTDDHFLVDGHEEIDGVTIVSACSGHGFKHSAAIGEALARRTAGLEHLPLDAFQRQARRPWPDTDTTHEAV